MYVVQSIHIWERVQDEKKQERQKCPAGTRQTYGKNWGLVWRNRKKISQIIKDYFHLLFFILIILCMKMTRSKEQAKETHAFITFFYPCIMQVSVLTECLMPSSYAVGRRKCIYADKSAYMSIKVSLGQGNVRVDTLLSDKQSRKMLNKV
jgi:hypothetical protein